MHTALGLRYRVQLRQGPTVNKNCMLFLVEAARGNRVKNDDTIRKCISTNKS